MWWQKLLAPTLCPQSLDDIVHLSGDYNSEQKLVFLLQPIFLTPPPWFLVFSTSLWDIHLSIQIPLNLVWPKRWWWIASLLIVWLFLCIQILTTKTSLHYHLTLVCPSPWSISPNCDIHQWLPSMTMTIFILVCLTRGLILHPQMVSSSWFSLNNQNLHTFLGFRTSMVMKLTITPCVTKSIIHILRLLTKY
jgi:hypothetical protein